MKTFDKKDVFTLVTAEEAIAYIGKRGYFGDSFKELESNINKDCGDNLGEVFPDRYTSIVFRPYACETSYGLFIPTDKVKEVEEPKYRPFRTTEEFSKVTGKRIGSILKFRCGGNDKRYYTRMYIGFHILENGNIYIELGSEAYNLEQLYNYYEWLDEHGEWQPFGVEE